jgi:hypothetical protein
MTLAGVRGVRRPALRAAAGLLVAVLGACGGGAGSGSGVVNPPLPTGPNVAPILVDAGSAALGFNEPSVSVTVCAPGTANCQTINHILVDTGSVGLRIFASLLAPIALPPTTTAAGDPMYECQLFADGYTWGSVRLADLQLADGKAGNLPIQVIDDSSNPNPAAPADCAAAGNGPGVNTIGTFGENGVLGVGVFAQDCGSGCVGAAVPAYYYGCRAGGCVNAMVASLSAEVQNPVASFQTNNNGVVVVLPNIDSAGQASANGALVLGIDTQSNNQLGSASVLTADPATGRFTTLYNNQTLPASLFDTGSSAYFFADPSLPACTGGNAGLYCPATIQTLSATNQGHNGASSAISFKVTNGTALLSAHPGYAAFLNVGGTNSGSQSFDWGLPFFYGRQVRIAIEGRATSAGTGPFYAY